MEYNEEEHCCKECASFYIDKDGKARCDYVGGAEISDTDYVFVCMYYATPDKA
ncbi:MAG: hypothetical protein IKN95_09885 [Lachnospiraceae bacterium]|nr:hypothetical protein [Lachnospiraceae bacterium]